MKFFKFSIPIFFLFNIVVIKAQTIIYKKILINNIQIFNGKDNKISKGNILIENNLIKTISSNEIVVKKDSNTQIINGQGKFVIPGLIDAHAHILLESTPQMLALVSDVPFLNLLASKAAEKQLLRGFTTVRDLGGGALPLAKAIDMGVINGPRVYPSSRL